MITMNEYEELKVERNLEGFLIATGRIKDLEELSLVDAFEDYTGGPVDKLDIFQTFCEDVSAIIYERSILDKLKNSELSNFLKRSAADNKYITDFKQFDVRIQQDSERVIILDGEKFKYSNFEEFENDITLLTTE